jgi:DNA-binding NtrC family response regulator
MARILLVDDEPDIRTMLYDALRLRGHVVDVAAGADDAIRLASLNNYEVAVIDYVLPGRRGLDLLQDLRSKQPFLRSVIISGQIDHDILNASDLEKELRERIAADRYLSKPANVDDLTRVIGEVLEPALQGNWQQIAADAIAAKAVKGKDVKEMDKKLRKAKRPRKK